MLVKVLYQIWKFLVLCDALLKYDDAVAVLWKNLGVLMYKADGYYPTSSLYNPDQYATILIPHYSHQLRPLHKVGGYKIVTKTALLRCLPVAVADCCCCVVVIGWLYGLYAGLLVCCLLLDSWSVLLLCRCVGLDC
ncbi:hypothetical protein LOK49_LG07G00425 [Camellia lanceoleosa]|uniref:Uncharacterized protein n=1 Tax=Camellia lanceoleosa TaxID=1840588 RepID=A0ACC0H1B5_9ERIC|nr:hypothetical protein LOK49_LG07G00425 [Camellia lanceoleosa]